MTRDQRIALLTRPDLLAAECTVVSDRSITWRGRLAELGNYGTSGGSAADRRRIIEAMASLESDDRPLCSRCVDRGCDFCRGAA